MTKNSSYNGNSLIKRSGVSEEWTSDKILEWVKCKDDPIYFIEKYIKIVTIDHGLQPMILYDFQKEIICGILDNNKLIAACARQLGKCHHKDTRYTIRNKKTGVISSITAKEFHESCTPGIEHKLSKLSEEVQRAIQEFSVQ